MASYSVDINGDRIDTGTFTESSYWRIDDITYDITAGDTIVVNIWNIDTDLILERFTFKNNNNAYWNTYYPISAHLSDLTITGDSLSTVDNAKPMLVGEDVYFTFSAPITAHIFYFSGGKYDSSGGGSSGSTGNNYSGTISFSGLSNVKYEGKGTYSFLKSGSTLVSTNDGVADSASVSKLTFTPSVTGTLKVSWSQSSESGYDYGILSYLNSTLYTSNTADTSNCYSLKSATTSGSTETGTTTIGSVTAGTQYTMYIKYRKDGSVDSGNDEFIITNMSITASITSITISPTSKTIHVGEGWGGTNGLSTFITDNLTVKTNTGTTVTSSSTIGTVSPSSYLVSNGKFMQAGTYTIPIKYSSFSKNFTLTVTGPTSISPSSNSITVSKYDNLQTAIDAIIITDNYSNTLTKTTMYTMSDDSNNEFMDSDGLAIKTGSYTITYTYVFDTSLTTTVSVNVIPAPKVIVSDYLLTRLANKVRERAGTSTAYTISDMISVVNSLKTITPGSNYVAATENPTLRHSITKKLLENMSDAVRTYKNITDTSVTYTIPQMIEALEKPMGPALEVVTEMSTTSLVIKAGSKEYILGPVFNNNIVSATIYGDNYGRITGYLTTNHLDLKETILVFSTTYTGRYTYSCSIVFTDEYEQTYTTTLSVTTLGTVTDSLSLSYGNITGKTYIETDGYSLYYPPGSSPRLEIPQSDFSYTSSLTKPYACTILLYGMNITPISSTSTYYKYEHFSSEEMIALKVGYFSSSPAVGSLASKPATFVCKITYGSNSEYINAIFDIEVISG